MPQHVRIPRCRSPAPFLARRLAPSRAPDAAARPFARVEICQALEAARLAWTALTPEAPASPYQSFDFARAWFATIGAAEGATPLIVVARDEAGAPVALLPFARARARSAAPRRLSRRQGLELQSRPLPPSRRVVARRRRGAARRGGGKASRGSTPSCFVNQPLSWRGLANPLAAGNPPAEPELRLRERPARRLFRLARRARLERGEEEDAQEARAARSDGAARPQRAPPARKRSTAALAAFHAQRRARAACARRARPLRFARGAQLPRRAGARRRARVAHAVARRPRSSRCSAPCPASRA